jgi:hypothetical protein
MSRVPAQPSSGVAQVKAAAAQESAQLRKLLRRTLGKRIMQLFSIAIEDDHTELGTPPAQGALT